MAYKETENEKMKFVNKLITSKDNIIDQLILLREYKDREDVEEYINEIKSKASDYTKYLIEKYYEEKNDLIEPEKTPLENMFELLLRPSIIKEKIINYSETDIKVNDKVLITDGKYKGIEGTVKEVNNKYSEFLITINLFGNIYNVEIDFQDIIKK